MVGETAIAAVRTSRHVGLLTLTLLLAAVFLTPASATAAEGQSLDAVRDAVRSFLLDQSRSQAGDWDVRVHRLDPRLRLHACESPLQAFAPHGRLNMKGRTTVGVRCNDAKPWKLYVPVSIEHFIEVVVAVRPMTPGQRVVAADIGLARKNTAQLHYGYYRNGDAVVGQAVRQTLGPGDVLRPGSLAEPTLVRRGQELILVADTGNVQVSMSAVSLENGAKGERIRVRNRNSSRIVEGVVLDSHRVSVGIVGR